MDDTRGLRRLQARAVHRVTTHDIGRRVSVRHHLGAHAAADGSVSDVVGRLLGYTDGLLVIVDRHEQLHVVADERVVASRTIPEHPRRPAEPADLGTTTRPLFRRAARVLLLDPSERLLLAAHRPALDRWVWTAPGGGLRPDESHADAARRELREELGVSVDVGPWVWSRRVRFTFAGVHLDQEERWFLTRTDTLDLIDAPLDDAGLDHVRWWSRDELRTTDAQLAPAALPDHLDALLRDGPPDTAIDVGR